MKFKEKVHNNRTIEYSLTYIYVRSHAIKVV